MNGKWYISTNCHGKWKRHLEDTTNQVNDYVYVPQHFTMFLGNTLEVKNVVAPFMPWTAGTTEDCQVPNNLVWYGNHVGLILPKVHYTHGFEDEGPSVEEVGPWVDEGRCGLSGWSYLHKMSAKDKRKKHTHTCVTNSNSFFPSQ